MVGIAVAAGFGTYAYRVTNAGHRPVPAPGKPEGGVSLSAADIPRPGFGLMDPGTGHALSADQAIPGPVYAGRASVDQGGSVTLARKNDDAPRMSQRHAAPDGARQFDISAPIATAGASGGVLFVNPVDAAPTLPPPQPSEPLADEGADPDQEYFPQQEGAALPAPAPSTAQPYVLEQTAPEPTPRAALPAEATAPPSGDLALDAPAPVPFEETQEVAQPAPDVAVQSAEPAAMAIAEPVAESAPSPAPQFAARPTVAAWHPQAIATDRVVTPTSSPGPVAGQGQASYSQHYAMTVLDGVEVGAIPVRVTDGGASLYLRSFLSLFEARMDPGLFQRLASSRAANSYVSLETLDAAGLPLDYDAARERLSLRSTPQAGAR